MKEGGIVKRTVLRYLGIFLLSVCVATALLYLAACLPQEPIDLHVAESAEQLHQEGLYPVIFDGMDTSRLDTWTDAIILAQSKSTSIQQPEAIFTNPMYETTEDDPVENLYTYVHAQDPQPTSYYPRYWMGFRCVTRLLLTFLNYFQIRRYLAIAVLALWAAVICSICRRVGNRAAFLFALSIILVKPQIIVMNLQFSCCFLIAFGAMLAVPWLVRHPDYGGIFFFLTGIVTMYFDFYTTPALTFGLPMVYLYLLRRAHGKQQALCVREMAGYIFLWGAGYLGMWIAKLALTTLFTDVNGLQNGILSMMERLGIFRADSSKTGYSIIQAVRALWYALYGDQEGKVILIVTVSVLAVALVGLFIYRGVRISDFMQHIGLILLAAIPILWMLATPQPTYIHYWFQYRSIALSFWAFTMYCCTILEETGKLRKQCLGR